MFLINPKFAALVTVLLLSACTSSEKQPIADRSPEAAPSPSSNPIADATPAVPLGKAKATCGDALPKDEKAYPVSFYPVFVSYSDKNLELVKKHFCADAIKRRSEKLGKDVVQVGSFTSKERANALKSELSAHLQGADIGEPTLIQGHTNSTKDIGVAAKLSSQQIKELKEVVGISRDFKNHTVVVLPTDIPNGFLVSHFVTSKQKYPGPNHRFTGGHYYIVYKNERNECFSIDGGVMSAMGDEPTKYEQLITVHTPALGNVNIGIIESDRHIFYRRGKIGFTTSLDRIFIGKNEYSFISPVDPSYRPDLLQGLVCNRVSREDAIRVVRSMQFISP